MSYIENDTGMDMATRQESEVPLRGVRSNIVQSIRAFRVQDLQDAAIGLGQHFLYANLANAQSKQDVLDMIAQQFTFGNTDTGLMRREITSLHELHWVGCNYR